METSAEPHMYPPIDKNPIPSSTSFVAELPRLDSPEPMAKHIRGDSYGGGLDQMLFNNARDPNLSDEELEKQLQMRLMLAAAHSYMPPPHTFGPIVVVSSYTQFGDLAHGPRGTEATRSMRSYRLNISDGSLTLLSVTGEGAIHNPAFSLRGLSRSATASRECHSPPPWPAACWLRDALITSDRAARSPMGEAAVRDRARCGAGCEGAGCDGAAWAAVRGKRRTSSRRSHRNAQPVHLAAAAATPTHPAGLRAAGAATPSST